MGIQLTCEVQDTHIRAIRDSQLVTNQVSRDHHTKESLFPKYIQQILNMVKYFKTLNIVHALHEENVCVDLLTKLVSTKKSCLNKIVIQETLDILSTKFRGIVMIESGVS